MPGSARENDADVRAFAAEHEITTVLDVGPGIGTYADLLDDLVPVIDAVEVWQPYIAEFDLPGKYRRVIHGDVRAHAEFDYDLIVFGDVLEHMSRDDALTVWKTAGQAARYGLISVPIVHYPQDAWGGNPHEAHVQEDLIPDDIRADYGPFVFERLYEVTGTFIREFR
jgi:predicted TPR repeat methyltransferase